MPIDALNVLCAQLTRDLFAIAKFLFFMPNVMAIVRRGARTGAKIAIFDQYLAFASMTAGQLGVVDISKVKYRL